MRNRFKNRRFLLPVIVGVVLATAACGTSDDGAGGPAGDGQASTVLKTTPEGSPTDAELRAMLEVSLGKPTEPKDVNPLLLEALTIGAKPLTDAEKAKVLACLDEPVCKLGDGKLTIGIAESSAAVPFRKQQRALYIAQSLRMPDVGKIIYTDGRGDLQTALANFRSLVSQKVDVVTGNFDFGGSMVAVVRQAARAGITVASNTVPIAGAVAGKDYLNYADDPCDFAKEAVKAALESKDTSEPGHAVLYTGIPGNPFGSAYIPCAEKEFKAAGWTTSKGTTDWTPQGEDQAASALLATGKRVDAILYDYSPDVMVKKFLEAGQTPPTAIGAAGGAGFYRTWQSAKTDGHQFAGYDSNSMLWVSRLAVTAGVMKALGHDVDGDVALPVPVASLDTLADQYKPDMPSTTSFNSSLPTDVLIKALS
jgi:ABC-type sugar transport system substrate-binding protein